MINLYDQRVRELRGEPIYSSKGGQQIWLSEWELMLIESEIGHPLPEDYREFLRDYGIYSLDALFPLAEKPEFGGNWASMSSVYGLIPKVKSQIQYASSFDLLENYHNMMDYKPAELLLIGDNGGLGHVCLAIAGEHTGAVYYWDRVDFWETNDYRGIYLVANSFDEFMQRGLTLEEYEALPPQNN